MRFMEWRPAEWLFVAYFGYVCFLSAFIHDRPNLHYQPFLYLVSACALFAGLSFMQSRWMRRPIAIIRDWLPIFVTLIAFREMELFVPHQYDLIFERTWIRQDHLVLSSFGLKKIVEAFGSILPSYLELCYLLVYGLPAYCLATVAIRRDRGSIDFFWAVYLTGTLSAYALFPFFPSLPPRYAFPIVDVPTFSTTVRSLNLWLLKGATIHSGVFPSAHVSSSFSATWALYFLFRRKTLGHLALLYAVSVSIATVYGRYHYVADVIGGSAISLVALVVASALRKYVPKYQSIETT